MSHTLYCDFIVESERGAAYWWPLIFEAMHWHSFQFSAPGLPKGTSSYFYHRHMAQEAPSMADTDAAVGPFKALWDEIYLEIGSVIASFWFRDDPFILEVLVSPSESQELVIGLNLEGAELMSVSLEEARKRLLLMLDCAKTLYEICQPSTGEIYWLHAGEKYAPSVTFGKPLEALSYARTPLAAPQSKKIQQVLPSGGYIYLLDPVPIPRQGGEWDFVSLVG